MAMSSGKLSYLVHAAVALAACIFTLHLVRTYVPLEQEVIGTSYLIFFVHLPSALNALGFFLLGGLFSALYLWKRREVFDRYAVAALTVGLLACTITICTGSPWARAAWGHWWIWDDPRLLSVAITWFFYVGYLLLRWSVPEEDRRARFAAVFGIVAMISVPFVYFSIQLLGSKNHPMDVALGPEVKETVRVGMGAFFLLYALLLRLTAATERARRDLELLRRRVHGF